jgi:phosphonate transport system substrate-binding protein
MINPGMPAAHPEGLSSRLLTSVGRLSWLVFTLLALLAHPQGVNAAPQGNEQPLIVGVVPQYTPLQIHTDWTPLLERLSRDSGVPLALKIYPSIQKFEADLLKGVPDFAFMNPYHEVMARHAEGYVPLVRDSKPLTGVLLVRHDSPIQRVKELSGSKLAFPAPNAFGASLYMRALLAEQEGIKIEPIYVKTHSNVFRQVILGEVGGGGSVNSAFLREPAAVGAQLRIIFETPGVAPHPLSAHPRVSLAQRKAVAQAMLQLRQDAAAAPLLQAVQMATPVAADYARDYQPLERLKLEKYLVIEAD